MDDFVEKNVERQKEIAMKDYGISEEGVDILNDCVANDSRLTVSDSIAIRDLVEKGILKIETALPPAERSPIEAMIDNATGFVPIKRYIVGLTDIGCIVFDNIVREWSEDKQ